LTETGEFFPTHIKESISYNGNDTSLRVLANQRFSKSDTLASLVLRILIYFDEFGLFFGSLDVFFVKLHIAVFMSLLLGSALLLS